MLEQALTVLATAAGSAVVTAAGTDAWSCLRQTLALWFGAGDSEREQAALERLDQTAAALGAAPPPQAESVRIRQEAAWQTRVEDVRPSATWRRTAPPEGWTPRTRRRRCAPCTG